MHSRRDPQIAGCRGRMTGVPSPWGEAGLSLCGGMGQFASPAPTTRIGQPSYGLTDPVNSLSYNKCPRPGLEPGAYCLGGSRSIHLSYRGSGPNILSCGELCRLRLSVSPSPDRPRAHIGHTVQSAVPSHQFEPVRQDNSPCPVMRTDLVNSRKRISIDRPPMAV